MLAINMSKNVKSIIKKSNKFEAKAGSAYLGIGVDWPIFVEGKAAILRDIDGEEFVDLCAGIGGAAIVGHCHPKVVQAIKEQAEKLILTRYYNPHPVRSDLAEKLVRLSPRSLNKVVFDVGGADTIEKSLYFARAYTGKFKVLAFHGCFHGKTPGAFSLTANAMYSKEGFLPLLPGIIHVPYPYCYRCPFGKVYPECDLQCARYIQNLFKDRSSGLTEVGALVGEIIQNPGGVIVPPEEFWPIIRDVCTDNNVLLIADECFTGFGRTGKMFACEHYNIEPDILCVSKGIASGMPISAMIGKEEIMELEAPLSICGATYVGNALCWAAGLANIQVIEHENLVENARMVGEYFLNRLRELTDKHSLVGDVRGKGLHIGIEFVKNKETKRPAIDETALVTDKLLRKGIIVTRHGWYNNMILMRPPLMISRGLVDISVERIEETLNEIER